MAGNQVVGFLPSTSAFHFSNSFPEVPVRTISIPHLIDIPIGNAAGGLCGGMVFAARDFFQAKVDPPKTSQPPAPDSNLFNFLVDRLFDSFDIPRGVSRYFEWMQLRDEDHFHIPGIGHRTLEDSWPIIQADIDAGVLSPIGVVTVKSINPMSLKFNHQVLAYGYDVSGANGSISIRVYDPNHPDDDGIALTLNPGNDPPSVAFNGGLTVRGFFRCNYSPRDVVTV